MHSTRSTRLLATIWLVRLTGLVVVLSPLVKHAGGGVLRRLPLEPLHLSSSLAIIAGLSLIYLADQLANRKQQAYHLSLGLLAIVLLAELIHYHNPLPTILALGLGSLLLSQRHIFAARSDSVSLKRGLARAALVLGLAALYGTLGFLIIDQRAFGIEFGPLEALWATLRQFFSLTSAIPPLTVTGRWFLDSLDLIGITAFALALTALFKPLRFRLQSSAPDREHAHSILLHYGGTTEDYFKIWPEDKHYFFSRDEQAFLAYGVARGVALVLDGPSGLHASFSLLMQDFGEYCTINGWLPAILHADTTLEHQLSPDWRRYSIGNEAVIDSERFTHETLRDKHWRYIANKARRDGLIFELWPSPLSEGQLNELRNISKSWLGTDGRREYRFIMGYFDTDYLKRCAIGVLRRGDQVVAYANLVPSYDDTAVSIDHMRSMKDISPVSMHFLLARLIEYAAEEGLKRFNLGLAPLSASESTERSLTGSIVQGLKTIVKPVYSFEGVAQFKQKFRPEWEERYIYLRGRSTDLPRVGLALYDLVSFSRSPRD